MQEAQTAADIGTDISLLSIIAIIVRCFMKRICFLSLVLICVSLTFVGCFKNSGNPKIDDKDIDSRLLYNKITNSVNKEYLADVFSDNFESEYQSVVLPETADEIRNSLVEDITVIECCKEKEIFVDSDSSAQSAKVEFNNLNNDDSQKRYASALENVLSEYEVSENEYLDLFCEYDYYKYNRMALKKYFYENMYEENNNKTLDEQFDLYIKTLLK